MRLKDGRAEDRKGSLSSASDSTRERLLESDCKGSPRVTLLRGFFGFWPIVNATQAHEEGIE
jgi:hypothetical protein